MRATAAGLDTSGVGGGTGSRRRTRRGRRRTARHVDIYISSTCRLNTLPDGRRRRMGGERSRSGAYKARDQCDKLSDTEQYHFERHGRFPGHFAEGSVYHINDKRSRASGVWLGLFHDLRLIKVRTYKKSVGGISGRMLPRTYNALAHCIMIHLVICGRFCFHTVAASRAPTRILFY